MNTEKLKKLHQEMIASPNTRPETVAFLVEYLDRRHRLVAKTPCHCPAPIEIVNPGEGGVEIQAELTGAEQFARKYRL